MHLHVSCLITYAPAVTGGSRGPSPCDILHVCGDVVQDLAVHLAFVACAGKELDLHLFYCQVTSLGGLDAVIAGRKWSEVCHPFHFPASFTSKSFTMRKIYSQVLFHFEQVR